MPVRESAVLSIMSNRFILNNLIRKLYPKLTNLPNYGKNMIIKVIGLLNHLKDQIMIQF